VLANRINNLGVAPDLQVLHRIRLEACQLWCVGLHLGLNRSPPPGPSAGAGWFFLVW